MKLAPGMHTLQLLLGDKNHVPHSPPLMSERVRVTVTDASQASTAAADGVTRGRHPAPAGAKVYFENLSNGAIVSRTLTVRFGLRNMGVAPAGMEKPNTGHHHLLLISA